MSSERFALVSSRFVVIILSTCYYIHIQKRTGAS
jgi:hypothetical protein